MLGCIRISHYLFLIFKQVALNRRRGEDYKLDRKIVMTYNTLQQYVRILLTCFRARVSGKEIV